jgi:hypothetical protein
MEAVYLVVVIHHFPGGTVILSLYAQFRQFIEHITSHVTSFSS